MLLPCDLENGAGAGGRGALLQLPNSTTPQRGHRPGSRLRFSNSRSVVCYLNTYQVVPCNHLPKRPLTDKSIKCGIHTHTSGTLLSTKQKGILPFTRPQMDHEGTTFGEASQTEKDTV